MDYLWQLQILTEDICMYGNDMLKSSFILANHTSRTLLMTNVPKFPCQVQNVVIIVYTVSIISTKLVAHKCMCNLISVTKHNMLEYCIVYHRMFVNLVLPDHSISSRRR